MADDASGDDRDDRDGRDVQSEEPPDVTASDWNTDRNDRNDDTATFEAVEDDPTGEPNRRDADDGTDRASDDDRGDRDRIPIDLSGSDDESADAADEGYVPEPSSARIEPGDPDLEHAIFVLLGAIAMVLVIIRLLALPLG
ncbi:DUF7312 domain-containing protein [Halosolutus halophilus]|uniref:DUF7312 domain-containing protein n=1 Tax=Halosolutus halophilus TaxID=1552990 RepID=UPI002234FDA2|nr:hypothetical protein [Halosolutus halophilus]